MTMACQHLNLRRLSGTFGSVDTAVGDERCSRAMDDNDDDDDDRRG